MLDQQ